MIAVDTNILVYAHREDSEWHQAAYERIAELAEGRTAWGIPWPCIHEFLAIVTHLKIFAPPTPLEKALDQVDAWIESPSLVLFAESQLHWEQLRGLLVSSKVSGPRIHDARIAALCLQHGVRELWSADRDFGRFSGVTVTNPLIA